LTGGNRPSVPHASVKRHRRSRRERPSRWGATLGSHPARPAPSHAPEGTRPKETETCALRGGAGAGGATGLALGHTVVKRSSKLADGVLSPSAEAEGLHASHHIEGLEMAACDGGGLRSPESGWFTLGSGLKSVVVAHLIQEGVVHAVAVACGLQGVGRLRRKGCPEKGAGSRFPPPSVGRLNDKRESMRFHATPSACRMTDSLKSAARSATTSAPGVSPRWQRPRPEGRGGKAPGNRHDAILRAPHCARWQHGAPSRPPSGDGECPQGPCGANTEALIGHAPIWPRQGNRRKKGLRTAPAMC
jgi:hypothetical protein